LRKESGSTEGLKSIVFRKKKESSYQKKKKGLRKVKSPKREKLQRPPPASSKPSDEEKKGLLLLGADLTSRKKRFQRLRKVKMKARKDVVATRTSGESRTAAFSELSGGGNVLPRRERKKKIEWRGKGGRGGVMLHNALRFCKLGKKENRYWRKRKNQRRWWKRI